MGLVDLFVMASIPIVKVLLVTAIGLFLAFDGIDILGDDAKKHINKVVFYVFNPALVGSSLAKTITFKSFLTLWFMPVNVLFTFLFGSVFGWILVKVTKAPKHLKGLIIGACSAGNLGNLIIIIIPAICKEKGSPFGDPNTCESFGLAYSSLSMALGAIFLWSYVYNVVRASSSEMIEGAVADRAGIDEECTNVTLTNYTEPLLPTDSSPTARLNQHKVISSKLAIPFSQRTKYWLQGLSEKINLKALLAPSTNAAIIGFIIGTIPLIRKTLIGGGAPLHVVEDSASLIGDAAIPTVTLICGANLLRGLTGSGIQLRIVIGIVAVRYIFLPLLGILLVGGALHFGILQHDPLFQFVLLLQYAVPPAMNIGTITQLFGAGQNECSVIMLWTYALASVSLSLWSTFFLWLVAS